jgi:predicted RND superfamily exporter protein
MICTVLLFFIDRQQTLPFLAGAALISLNFVLLGALWHRILEKKSVAMTLGLVVIKYAILGAVLFIFIKDWKLPLLPLFAGLSSIGVSFLITAVLSQSSDF